MSKQKVIKINQAVSNSKLNENEVLFVRVDSIVESKKDLIEVPFTHNAYVIKGGGDIRFYKSGTHNIFDDKQEVREWKKGATVEVIYIPKEVRVLVRWGTPSRFPYNDPVRNMILDVGANGHFRVSVSNPEQFIRVIVGQTKQFDLDRFSATFAGEVRNSFGKIFQSVATSMNLSYEQFEAYRDDISQRIGAELSKKFDKDYGISLVDFAVDAINVSAANIEKIKFNEMQQEKERQENEQKAERERLEAERKQEIEKENERIWLEKKYQMDMAHAEKMHELDVNKAIGISSAMAGKPEEVKAKVVFCNNCGTKLEEGELFCHECGARRPGSDLVCPNCHHKNPSDTKFCSKCGTKLI